MDMKTRLYIITASAGLMLAGCVNDEVVDVRDVVCPVNPAAKPDPIGFVQKVDNLTRGNNRAEKAGHYEFGVFGYKGANKEEVSTNVVMNDYLVAYGDIVSGTNKWYDAIKTGAETYEGDEANGTDNTVSANGKSTWFYETIAQAEGKHKTFGTNHLSPSTATQILKYWDEDFQYHNFYAYMPYYGDERKATSKVVIAANANAEGGADFKFKGLSAFYTDPVVIPGAPSATAQVTTADERFAPEYSAASREAYNMEVTNANEALYSAQSVESDIYRVDVPFTFRHVNAKINVAFWEDIRGYKIGLIDLVPEGAADKIAADGSLPNDNDKSTSVYKGVAWTPATPEQALNIKDKPVGERSEGYLTNEATTPRPSYMSDGTIATAGVKTDTRADISYDAEDPYRYTNENIRFGTEADGAIPYNGNPCAPDARVLSETGGNSATMLNTHYYALPNVDEDGYTIITPGYGGSTDYKDKKVGENTGFTVHVSYELIPEDGAATTKVYDARAYVGPEYCKWEDGKQYTYIFKITSETNGTTTPTKPSDEVFEDGKTDEPYVDPDDPRVPNEPALIPIVFDGITITDYEETTPKEIVN